MGIDAAESDDMADRAQQEQTADALDQLFALSPTAPRHPPQTLTTNEPTASKTETNPSKQHFFVTLCNHYASRSDPISPHFFAQLSKDYNSCKLDDMKFYIAAYRLFYTTDSVAQLLGSFKELLPPGLRCIELGWLDQKIEEDTDRERERSREAFGQVADGLMRMETQGAGDTDLAATFEESKEYTRALQASLATTGENARKKVPLKGFRTPYSTTRDETRSARAPELSNSPQPAVVKTSKAPSISAIDTPTATKLSIRNSPTKHKAQTPNSPHYPPPKRATPAIPTRQTRLLSAIPESQKPSQCPSSATKLPFASIVPHLGPIYPTTRAILSRLTTRPYTHSLCGQRFGHPAEVKRHHDGQNGRPGCWEKCGKPKGKAWDEHASCKVTLKDLEYVRVQEGWVVTDWGSIDVEGIREGEEEGLVGGVGGESGKEEMTNSSVISDGGSGASGGKKRKAASQKDKKSKLRSQVKREEEEESDAGLSEEMDEDDEGDSFSDAEFASESRAKRVRIAADFVEEAVSDINAVRAVALGLRARARK